ncbi:MAG: hypothetical protein ABMA13_18215 [Chthoniobacteraceae bacterium]
MKRNELEVRVINRPGLTYFARCLGATASCTSSPAVAAQRAAAKATAKSHSIGLLWRACAPDEIEVRQVGTSWTWVATFPMSAYGPMKESEVAA